MRGNRFHNARAGMALPLFAGALACTGAAEAQPGYMKQPSPTLAAMRQTCRVGTAAPEPGVAAADYRGSGPTPLDIAGAVIVSPQEAKCVLDRFPGTVLVADAADDGTLPDALGVGFARSSMATPDKMQAELVRVLGAISGGNKAMPIIVYCHHSRCGYSYHAARRMAAAGYSSVLWMRNGGDGWRKAGYQTAAAPARWVAPVLGAHKTLSDCYHAQPVPAGTDVADLTERRLAKCRPQADAMRKSFGPWYSADAANRVLNEMTVNFRSATELEVNSRQAAAKRAADKEEEKVQLAAEAADWHRKQGFGLPADQLMTGYQYCIVDGFDQQGKMSKFRSDVFPVRIAKAGAADLHNYNVRMITYGSVHGDAFRAEIDRRFKPYRRSASCTVRMTKAEAEQERAAWFKDADKYRDRYHDIAWKPGL